jgi:hypothetical protein
MANVIKTDKMTQDLKNRIAELDRLPEEALAVWVENTPVASGRARSQTKLQKNTIFADYDYAVPLDNGSSRQSPRGMSKPTGDFIKNKTRKILRKR